MNSVTLKRPRHIPDVWFALNHAADHFASQVAETFEVPLHMASGILFHTKLVKQIQSRLFRVLITSCPKTPHEKAILPMKPPAPSLEDIIQASPHNLQRCGNEFRCLDCGGVSSATSKHAKLWLASSCSPLPYDDRFGPVPIPGWYSIYISGSIPHSSHSLFSIKGITFFQSCGAFAAKKCRLLNRPCSAVCSPFCARALTKLRVGELPVSTMCWPRRPSVCLMRPPQSISSRGDCASSLESGGPASFFDDPNADIWEEE